MAHASVNFDRSGYQQDLNVCFPLERLHELVEEGFIDPETRRLAQRSLIPDRQIQFRGAPVFD